MKEEYNGWRNYATWRVNLEVCDGFEPDEHAYSDVNALADFLQETTEETVEAGSEEGIARDYAMAFLSEVDWHEIAEAMADTYPCIEGTVQCDKCCTVFESDDDAQTLCGKCNQEAQAPTA